MNRELVSRALSGLDDRHISDTMCFSPGVMRDAPERTVHMKKKRILTVALAAALLLALGVTAYAVSGIVRSTGTHAMPKAANYASLSDLPVVEKDVGYPVTVPERFSNGCRFAGLRVEGEAVFGENDEPVKEYYSVLVTYSRPGAADRCLSISPVLELPGGAEAPEPSERRIIGGVAVDLSRDHYKLVPEGYEKTEADREMEAAGHYYISFVDAEEITERDYAFAGFVLNSANYMLMDMDADDSSLDDLAQMAAELIAAANGG